ncbi:NapC/NirT family cytochrome c [Desulfovibrio sp. OttesenSCG-928-A18]|nr:NapC/NirT family cytochrome c [Desulfovibrio sp. OttesenSCG-928-A18]
MGEKKTNYRLAAVILGGVVVLCAVSAFALQATSTYEFCSATCHEMNVHAEELRFSSHAKDKDGKRIDCVQCHIPAGFGPRYFSVKTYSGLKDLYVHFFGDPDNLYRAELQPVARRFIDDANCLACHADLSLDAKGEKPISAIGKLAHDAYQGKNGQARSNCAGCHINLAHLPEFDRRLTVNTEFTSRILHKEALR